ncbi:hypothetical protein E3T40_04135 [Cryobacterium sp. TMT1-19]|uniref:deaminase n=1 Tax=Cryobacterium sp. TMT1-19 TaxID=1259231 RepID=UPI00106B1666|nr:deaminase [Cryobacterium sp. TMT1-19]TFD37783.1 hypothetical protein E3T40_04135 [Cryobacterium sp. TMT1-19]
MNKSRAYRRGRSYSHWGKLLVDAKRVPDFEIVIGFVAPIGTDLDALLARLQDELRVYAYQSETIRLSQLLDVDRAATESFGYYTARMDKGDELRDSYKSGDALAAIAAARMLDLRGTNTRARRFAWLLRTLKHEDEVSLLRQTYGKRFVLVGVQQDAMTRLRNLSTQLRDESQDSLPGSAAGELMRRDEKDIENKFGQQGRDVYSQADYLIDMSEDVGSEVARLVGLLFGDPFLTPTRDEVAMHHAFGASLRSADPGRQVGAVITTSEGEIVSTGSNEVPKAGGGEYWAGDPADGRDFTTGGDYNKKQTRRTLNELVSALNKGGFLSSELSDKSAEARLTAIMESESADLNQTRMMSLIEFGRIVHAEMSALMQAARLGISVKGATLYTTAFPCHMCMRLIVASGVLRIVYVDPYPKSLALEMYTDSVTPERGANAGLVSIQPFCGASWSLYPLVFADAGRKRTPAGNFEPFVKASARMRLAGPEPLANAAALESQIPIALSDAGSGRENQSEAGTKVISRVEDIVWFATVLAAAKATLQETTPESRPSWFREFEAGEGANLPANA